VENWDDLGVVVVTAPEPMHYYALFSVAHGGARGPADSARQGLTLSFWRSDITAQLELRSGRVYPSSAHHVIRLHITTLHPTIVQRRPRQGLADSANQTRYSTHFERSTL